MKKLIFVLIGLVLIGCDTKEKNQPPVTATCLLGLNQAQSIAEVAVLGYRKQFDCKLTEQQLIDFIVELEK
jgi:hypothetical protein